MDGMFEKNFAHSVPYADMLEKAGWERVRPY
jgi:hypothetical protein